MAWILRIKMMKTGEAPPARAYTQLRSMGSDTFLDDIDSLKLFIIFLDIVRPTHTKQYSASLAFSSTSSTLASSWVRQDHRLYTDLDDALRFCCPPYPCDRLPPSATPTLLPRPPTTEPSLAARLPLRGRVTLDARDPLLERVACSRCQMSEPTKLLFLLTLKKVAERCRNDAVALGGVWFWLNTCGRCLPRLSRVRPAVAFSASLRISSGISARAWMLSWRQKWHS